MQVNFSFPHLTCPGCSENSGALWLRLVGPLLLLAIVSLSGCGTSGSGSAPQQLDLGAGYAESKAIPLSAARHSPIAVPAGSAASLLTESAVI